MKHWDKIILKETLELKNTINEVEILLEAFDGRLRRQGSVNVMASHLKLWSVRRKKKSIKVNSTYKT